MPTTDPRIDAYIEKSAEFAQPVMAHLRDLIHKACPQVSETLKWSMPSFEYKGILCGFAAFKNHCTFGFWKQSLMETDVFPKNKTAMGSFGRITSLKDLPSDKVMIDLIHEAMELNEKGIKVARPKPSAAAKKDLVIPDDLVSALNKNKKAQAQFDRFSYSHRKEYIQWITEAKTEPTRNKRLATTIEWLAEGKSRNWKYENC
ncbi:MAG TPA: YdeI/OmpD-associated family protein [Pyrinomonadaceae bacterium]|nr:YdeI/OmpD-associated family protein [Pyrinomonadaceae bacterium]